MVAVRLAHDEDGLAAAGAGVLDEPALAPALDGPVGRRQSQPGGVGTGDGMELADAECASDRQSRLEQGGLGAVVSSGFDGGRV
jgi:hypothetical protein